MPEEEVEITEDLRQLTWEVLISRDHLLKIAEKLPTQNRERAHQTADRLMGLCTRLREIIKIVPAGVTMPESLLESMADMRINLEQGLRELDVLIRDLRLMSGEPEEGETTQALDIN